MFRHLPPTATPLPLATFSQAMHPPADAVTRFRHTFADATGATACYTASSGRTALFLLLAALVDTPDSAARDEVIIPAYTCPSLVRVVLDAGLTPRLVDIDPATFAFVPAALNAALSTNTLAVILVHPFGIPLPVTPVLTAAEKVGARVIEDAAQSMGARLDGRPVGTAGDFGLYSLGPGKPLSAGGGGILTVNPRAAAFVPALNRTWQQLPPPSSAGNWTAAGRLAAFTMAFEPHGWWLATRAGAQRAGDDEKNWGFALTELTAAQATIALEQLPRLDAYNRVRRGHAERIRSAIMETAHFRDVHVAPESDPFYLRFPVIFRQPQLCAAVHAALHGNGIGAGRMYKATLASLFPQLAGDFPGAEQVAAGLLTLPTHHFLTSGDITRMATIIRAAVSG